MNRPLRVGHRAEAGDVLRAAVTELTAAIDEGGDHLPDTEVIAVEKVLKRAAERLSLSGRHTVVALAGATGSGKSTLFNALVGQEVARSGHLRPTTTRPAAALWDAEWASGADDLLDWLRIRDRHHVALGGGPALDDLLERDRPAPGSTDGLVLVDLPDIDSTRVTHRAEADRILSMADVFVWVTDPQKYADARLHEDYLRRAVQHAEVTIVVLNQIDRLTPLQAQECLADLRGLLRLDGLGTVDVLACSATTGAGVAQLFAALSRAVAAAEATRLRLLGDVRAGAAQLRSHVADTEAQLGDKADATIIDALADSAGVPVVLASVAADHRRRAAGATGWPFTRWARRLRPDPLKRLRLDAARDPSAATAFPEELEPVLQRSSLPQPTPAARAAVDLVTRRLGASAAAGLPQPWAQAVERAAQPAAGSLSDALDQAILGTSLHLRRPLWWALVGVLQVLLAVAAVAGVAWLSLLFALAWFQLPVPEVPTLWYLPLPTLMAIGGLVGGIVLALLSRAIAARQARRRVDTIALRLRDRIGTVVTSQLLAPVRDVLQRHRATREHLDAAIDA
ncbi:GTP-binding protein EngB required for normal cell division [Kineosphaera limosa]|nr:GTPase [Kineosphaera limosa]NYE02735.1 GTP-binding protein EngB required for normal cell division [Kineosphaera limosa]